MQIRRIVTGHDSEGQAIVVSDEQHERPFQSLPGFANTLLWATDGVPQVGSDRSGDPVAQVTNYLPGPAGTRLMMVSVPPDASMMRPDFDGAAYANELTEKVPGFIQVFEPDSPGMHTTDTVDYGLLLEGEIWLELDDGRELRLAPHDLVIQNGTRHAWRNKSNRQATLLFVLIGAQRTA